MLPALREQGKSLDRTYGAGHAPDDAVPAVGAVLWALHIHLLAARDAHPSGKMTVHSLWITLVSMALLVLRQLNLNISGESYFGPEMFRVQRACGLLLEGKSG